MSINVKRLNVGRLGELVGFGWLSALNWGRVDIVEKWKKGKKNNNNNPGHVFQYKLYFKHLTSNLSSVRSLADWKTSSGAAE